MKKVLEPIEVEMADGLPQQLCWRRRRFLVEISMERWVWRGRWWMDRRLWGERRLYYRVGCRPQNRGSLRVFEIFRHEGGWILSRIVD